MEKIRRLNGGNKDKEEMMWVKVEREEDKKRIWERKKNLKSTIKGYGLTRILHRGKGK